MPDIIETENENGLSEPTYTSESAVPETLRLFCAACGLRRRTTGRLAR